MRRSWVVVVPFVLFALGCERSDAAGERPAVAPHETQTQGREARRAPAKQASQEPAGPEEGVQPAQERPSAAQERASAAQEERRPSQEQAQPTEEQARERLQEGVSEQPARIAVAELEGEAPSEVEGTVVLSEEPGGRVLLEANLAGLEPGTHRVVIRDAGTCDEAAEIAARATRQGEERAARAARTPERAPEPAPAAGPTTGERTIGEIEVGREGAVRYRLLTNQLRLEGSGPESVIGKTVVIEADPSAGTAEEAACGVIESAG